MIFLRNDCGFIIKERYSMNTFTWDEIRLVHVSDSSCVFDFEIIKVSNVPQVMFASEFNRLRSR